VAPTAASPTLHAIEKNSSGKALKPRSHLHPKVGMTMIAKTTSKHAPIAQNTWIATEHLHTAEVFSHAFKNAILQREIKIHTDVHHIGFYIKKQLRF